MKLLVATGMLVTMAVGCSPVHVRSNRVAPSPPVSLSTSTSSTSTSVDTTTTAVGTTETTVVAMTAPTTVATTVAPTTVARPRSATAPVTTKSTRSVAAASGFEQCVIVRESGGDPHVGSGGLYGILPSTWHSLGRSGNAGAASLAEQKAAFGQLYAKYGKQPWSAFDGCR